jgi:pentalenene oxygenase
MAGDVLLGVDLGPDVDPFARSLGELMTALPRLTPPLPGTRAARELAAVHARIDALVAARRADGSGTGDLIDVLLVGGLPDEAIRGEVLAFLLAAVDEPPSGLAAAVFLLGRNPDAGARLHQELDAGGDDTPYLDAVLREALRLYPPARYLDRCPMHDVEIGGTAVAAGTDVVLSPLVTHRDPALYERPDVFEPERWLEAPAAAARPRGASIPFGAGVHSCIGEPLARLIMGVTLAAIARRWRLRLDADAPEPVPRAPRLVVTVERR